MGSDGRGGWPGVSSVVLASTDERAVCAWNLQEGGKRRDMSEPYTTETFTATLTMTT